MKIIKCQGLGCDIRLDCNRYEPEPFNDNTRNKFYFSAKRLNRFFKGCLFFKSFK